MAKPDTPYPPASLAMIRQARADLYAAQAERRRVMLATGRWQLPIGREVGPVQMARQTLDQARATAQNTATPIGSDDADL